MQRKSGSNYSEGTYYIYRCCKDAGSVLKEAVNGLYDWLQPNMLEDLCFWDANGVDFLYTIAHEEMCGIRLNEEEAIQLADLIPGLFIELEAHRDFECYLDDAIKHQTDRLTISSYQLTEIPDRIGELKQLKYLEIFEQDILRLPPEMGLLKQLEHLNISYTGIEELPPELEKLTMLRVLNVSNSLIKSKPTFLSRMPNLEYVNLSDHLTGWE